MFTNIEYLLGGNEKQQQAYHAISSLGIMDELASYHPVLCGTIPFAIDIESSDLDIIIEGYDLVEVRNKLLHLYGHHQGFVLKRIQIRNQSVIKANFIYKGFTFEIFAQNQPTTQQYAYVHMIIEYNILQQNPSCRKAIIQLKEQGIKTEPAFCQVLGLVGDPYEVLIEYGIRNNLIGL